MNDTPQYLSPNEIKSVLVEILNVVVDFCKRNNLRHYLAYGTLIGAIRHRGFIPWDDDIDIWMPRPDYERFIHSFSHEYLQFHSMETDIDWPLNFGKVCDHRYSAIDENGKDFGLYLDIFPLDGVPDDPKQIDKFLKRIRRWENIWSNQLFSPKQSVSRNNTLSKNLKIIIGKTLSVFVPFKSICNKLINTYPKLKFDESIFVCYLPGRKFIFERNDFEPAKLANFEGHDYLIPHNYDGILKKIYGDYMQIPPEGDRISHGIRAYLKTPQNYEY